MERDRERERERERKRQGKRWKSRVKEREDGGGGRKGGEQRCRNSSLTDCCSEPTAVLYNPLDKIKGRKVENNLHPAWSCKLGTAEPVVLLPATKYRGLRTCHSTGELMGKDYPAFRKIDSSQNNTSHCE